MRRLFYFAPIVRRILSSELTTKSVGNPKTTKFVALVVPTKFVGTPSGYFTALYNRFIVYPCWNTTNAINPRQRPYIKPWRGVILFMAHGSVKYLCAALQRLLTLSREVSVHLWKTYRSLLQQHQVSCTRRTFQKVFAYVVLLSFGVSGL